LRTSSRSQRRPTPPLRRGVRRPQRPPARDRDRHRGARRGRDPRRCRAGGRRNPQRADAAIGEADAALARYRERWRQLAVETERIEHSITALREQAHALEEERRRVDVAIDVLRRRPAR